MNKLIKTNESSVIEQVGLNYIQDALSPNTLRALKSDSKVFADWCESNQVPSLPAKAIVIAKFIDEMASVKSSATIKRYISSISYMHKIKGQQDETKLELVKLALKRMTRMKGTRQKQAKPIGNKEAQAMIKNLDKSLHSFRNKALLFCMRDLLARRSEIVALNVEDITFADDTATVLIRRSKTDQDGKGEVKFLGNLSTKFLKDWLTKADISDGAIFRSVTNTQKVTQKRLPSQDVSRILKKMAKRSGINFEGISGHSCRVGMAQDLLAFGCDLAEIMEAGRWKSASMPSRYTERLQANRGAVAKYYGIS